MLVEDDFVGDVTLEINLINYGNACPQFHFDNLLLG
jgi:hypothetical protein